MNFIPERILTKQIEKYIEHLQGFKPEALDVDSHAVLKSIEAQHGIFVERAKKVYSFAHLTFQEYFTAKYIVDNAREGILETLVNEHLYDDKWKEVFLLVAGMLDNADVFLLLIKQKNDEYLKESVLHDLLKVTEQALLEESEWSTVKGELLTIITENKNLEDEWLNIIRKNIAIHLVLKSRNALFTTITNHPSVKLNPMAQEILIAIFLRRVLSFNLNRDLLYGGLASYDSDSDIASLFGLDFGILETHGKANKIGKRMKEEVANYIIGNALISKCLQSDAFISKPIREKILNEMLMPRKEGE